MSNSLAVASVTAVLSRMLSEALAVAPDGSVQSATVTTLRPDMLAAADAGSRGINVFLYQVSANAALAAADLPARRGDATVVTKPHQALDLHYLLTFTGDESLLEPQRLMGTAISTVVARPVLSRELVRAVIERAQAEAPNTWQQFSDLAEQIDVVRLTWLPLNLEELSKLWSTFLQAPYRLSVTYQATVVLVDGEVVARPALPVPPCRRRSSRWWRSIPSFIRAASSATPTTPRPSAPPAGAAPPGARPSGLQAPHALHGIARLTHRRLADARRAAAAARPDGARHATRVRASPQLAPRRPGDLGQPWHAAPRPPLRRRRPPPRPAPRHHPRSGVGAGAGGLRRTGHCRAYQSCCRL